MTADLATAYRAWLVSPHPARPHGAVAGAAVRRGLAQGTNLGNATRAAWAALDEAWCQAPATVWAWSDLHLFHANIIRYSGRPVADVASMNQQLLEAAQACVAPTDWLLFGGDLSLGEELATATWLTQCPGRKALILGNHDVDRQKLNRWKTVWSQFEAIASVHALAATARTPPLWCTHYPLGADRIPPGTRNVHGHIHQHVLAGPYLNLCVEQQGLRPVRLIDRLIPGP